jgi:SET domain-containing protein
MNEDEYRPLPQEVEIRKSSIEGVGLFAKEPIRANSTLGVTHVANEQFQHGFVRTPLGGFVNHSDNYNCVIEDVFDLKCIRTIKDIMPDEELTVKYRLYTPKIKEVL